MKATAIYRTLCANTTHLRISAGNNAPFNPSKHFTQNCAHSSCVEKERLHTYTKQYTESYVNIYMCIFLFQIIIHIQVVTETEEVGWVMEGTVCAQDYTFYGKIHYLLRTGLFYRS